MDEVIVGFPSREWARCAITDLATEGCLAELLDGGDERGCWQLRVSGPADKISEIRLAARGPAARVDWAAFVNLALAGRA